MSVSSSPSAEFGKDDEVFMAGCLCSFDNQLGKIDLNVLAGRLGKNAKSAESKFYALKKKYGFTIKVTFNKAQVPTKVVKPKRTPKKATKKANVTPKTSPEALEEAQDSEDDAIALQSSFLDSFDSTVPVSPAILETLPDEA